MKTVMFVAAMVAALCLCGCGYEPNPDGTDSTIDFSECFVRTVRGHEYLVFSVRQGCSALHSASCPCRKGGEE